MKRIVVLLLVCSVACAIGATSASATSDANLLATYEPTLVFDPHEQFLPSAVESFIADSQLERLDGSGAWVVANAHPTVADVAAATGPGVRLNQRSCTPSLPIGGLACYAAAARSAEAPVIYGRVARDAGFTVLQYWLFYYHDVYSTDYPAADTNWQAHEGDWEVVNVVLSTTEEPLYAAYSQHCSGERRSWDKVSRSGGTHPLVYVAVGSHSNEFSPGLHAIDPRCASQSSGSIPGQGQAPGQSPGSVASSLVDYAFQGPVVGSARTRGRAALRLVSLDPVTSPWLSFAGFWGELQYLHAPPPIGTLALGTSPVGPAFHDVYKTPIATISTWAGG